MKHKKTALTYLAILFSSTVYCTETKLPTEISRKLSEYNVTWDSPSTTGSLESMPLGNGDISANVWVEKDGDLVFYIGKTDTWSEATRLLKVGRVRVSLSPNPFSHATDFKQELNLERGELTISSESPQGKAKLTMWIDANGPVINVTAKTSVPTIMSCTAELLRPREFILHRGNKNPEASGFTGVRESPIPPKESADIFIPNNESVTWYHRNQTSFFSTILERQNVGELTEKYPDPYLNRTFGATLFGKDMKARCDSTLASARPTKNNHISIAVLTDISPEVSDWQKKLDDIVDQVKSTPQTQSYKKHLNWWSDFWNRSWIFLSGNENARTITRAYLLQRYMIACQGRGAYPIKFNGGTLNFDYQGHNGDFRTWGPGYWCQNTRLIYWPLAASGDYEMLKPWFDMYTHMMPLQRDVTRKYYSHGGAFFPETVNFFGMFIQDDWGWNNTGTASQTRWIRYHYEGALEVLAEMLDYYKYSQDEDFARYTIVPFATEVLRFFGEHWPTINGKYHMIPANSIEQFWDCLNPLDCIAGVMYDVRELRKLPEGMVAPELQEEWTRILNAMPDLPRTRDRKRLAPAEEYGEPRNFENPECYAIFPFRLFGKGLPDYDTALRTYRARRFKASNCWSQCVVQAALLGLDNEMEQLLLRNATSTDPAIRFPAFWKPGSDYTPDFDNGGVMSIGLQRMLLDNRGDSIILLQAMPDNWEVDFKLHAHQNTTVHVMAKGKKAKSVKVTPVSRTKDIKY